MTTRLAAVLTAAVALFVTGCVNVTHHRVITVAPDGTRTIDDKEYARFLFQQEAASKVSVRTTDSPSNYTHAVSATGFQAIGDTDLIKAISEGVAQGLKSSIVAP